MLNQILELQVKGRSFKGLPVEIIYSATKMPRTICKFYLGARPCRSVVWNGDHLRFHLGRSSFIDKGTE